MFKRIVNKIISLIMIVPRKLYYKRRKKALTNHTPTIVCNNCIREAYLP